MSADLVRDGRDDPEDRGTRTDGADVVAAGAVVVREGPAGPETLLVHRPRLDDWSVPKGKLDSGEHQLVAAVREVTEETGVVPALGRRLAPARYRVGGTQRKLVHYWTATVVEVTDHAPDDEVDETRWLGLGDAAALATHRWDRRALTGLAARADPAEGIVGVPPVVLVRHAKAVARRNWTGDDALRPLAPVGTRQSLSLVPLLATLAPGQLLTSPSTRCVQTIGPFGLAVGTLATPVPALSQEAFTDDPGAAPALVESLLAARVPGGRAVVVCTHRPVLDAVLAHLTGRAADDDRLAPAEFVVLTGRTDSPQVDRYPPTG